MPLFDFRCEYYHVTEALVSSDVAAIKCPWCGQAANKLHLVAAKPAWLALAQGDSASPEAVERFDKMHRQQAAKETKSMQDHGDYGPRPGAD